MLIRVADKKNVELGQVGELAIFFALHNSKLQQNNYV